VNRVELSIVHVIRIEKEVKKAIPLSVFKPEFMEQPAMSLTAVKVQVGRDLLGGPIDDV